MTLLQYVQRVMWVPKKQGDVWTLYVDGVWTNRITRDDDTESWCLDWKRYETWGDAKLATERAAGVEVKEVPQQEDNLAPHVGLEQREVNECIFCRRNRPAHAPGEE